MFESGSKEKSATQKEPEVNSFHQKLKQTASFTFIPEQIWLHAHCLGGMIYIRPVLYVTLYLCSDLAALLISEVYT